MEHQPSLFAPDGGPSSEPGFRLRPGARAERVSLFEREVRERLSATAVDLLLGRAQVLSEGSRARSLPRADGTAAADPYFGCTMLTVELAELSSQVREAPDAALATRVAQLLTTDARAGRRVRSLAEREACRVAGARVEPLGTDVRVRAVGARLQIDVDLEGTIEASPAAAQAGGR